MYKTPVRDHKQHRLRKYANNVQKQFKGYITFQFWRIIFRSLMAGLNWKRRPIKKVSAPTKADNGSYNSYVGSSVSQGTIRSYTHFFVR